MRGEVVSHSLLHIHQPQEQCDVRLESKWEEIGNKAQFHSWVGWGCAQGIHFWDSTAVLSSRLPVWFSAPVRCQDGSSLVI